MANLVEYLSFPIRKLFNTPEFKAAAKKLGFNQTSPVSYPFMWYPEAGITSAGTKFKYTDGTELISYHIKGITTINSNTSGFEQYLCSVRFPASQGSPFIFPGSITGMFMSGTGPDIITTPLANGGLVELNGSHVPVSSFDINLYNYGNNPQEDGTYIYALVIDATVENPNSDNITGLAAYDFEFLLPSFFPAPTIFQD